MDVKNFDTKPLALEIKKIMVENPTVNTYVFEYDLASKPGQFVMLWIPGVDEKPFSVAYDDGKEFWLTVCKVGAATEALFKMKEGEKVGIRGPFGSNYELEEGSHLGLVAGGYGAAPMYNVALEALKKNCKVEFMIGARDKDNLLYIDRIKDLDGVNLHVSTDDGSLGHKGFVTQVLEKVVKENKLDRVFTCGPEIMMKYVAAIAEENEIKCFMSMERYMKCGFGVCGQCAVDDTGELACKKGPVMDWDYVKNLRDFASYHRDAQGKRHDF